MRYESSVMALRKFSENHARILINTDPVTYWHGVSLKRSDGIVTSRPINAAMA